jgi:hypothetical protein
MAYGRGTCRACGRDVAVAANGVPVGTHKRELIHNPDAAPDDQVKTWTVCRGSRREVVEQAGRRRRELQEKAGEVKAAARTGGA